MIIDCIGCLHGSKPALQGGDLLIVTGDLTARDTPSQHAEFQEWLDEQEYIKKIVIAGNHDGYLEKTGYHLCSDFMKPIKYLEDSSTQFEGIKIYGSPWTPTFCDWHFMKDRGEELKKMWDLIPDDIDILITHGPARGILDYSRDEACGCDDLRNAIERIKPALHVFSHIHEGYGTVRLNHGSRDTIHVNCAIMDTHYKPNNCAIRVIYDQDHCRVL